MLEKFTVSYDKGELDAVKKSIIPFLKDHLDDLKKFVKNFKAENKDQPLDTLVKFFFLSMNMPVNFNFYLSSQSKTMEDEIGPEIKNPEKRSKLVSGWIGANAKNYRAHSILEQIYCFERCKKELLPEIEKIVKDLN